MSGETSAPGSDGANFKRKVSRVAAAAMLTVATASGAAAMSGCAEKPTEATTISNIAEQEREISEKNTEFVKSNSKKVKYVSENGGGKNDILYATGWVGQAKPYGEAGLKYELVDVENLIKNIPENAGIDLNAPNQEIKVVILVRNDTE